MAKPFEDSDTSHLSFVISDPSHFSTTRVPTSRKRPRDSNDDPADIAEDSHKTRRVNPQRLAARLGADLVSEMEALIYPGAKMPTFEVRRVIQERYAVDRRHIYDYFHSRGLRVAKEDKHTNLTRGRLSKALARQSLEKPLPDSDSTKELLVEPQVTETSPMESQLVDNKQIEQKAIPVKLKLKLKLDSSLKSPEQLPLRSAKRVASKRISGMNLGRRRHTLSGEMTSVSTTDKHVPPKARRRLPPTTSVPAGVDAVLPTRMPSPCPEFTLLDGSSDFRSNALHVPDLPPSSGFFFEQSDLANDVSLEISFDDYERDSLASIEEHRPLTRLERLELYNLINDNIGTSGGIEECAGTYGAYMKGRLQHYFDRISIKAIYGTRTYRVQQGDLHSSTTAIGDDVRVDFQKWVSHPHQQDENLKARQIESEPGKEYPLITGTEGSTQGTVLDAMKKPSLGDEAHLAEAQASRLHYEYDIGAPSNSLPLLLLEDDGTTEGLNILATPTLQPSMFYPGRSRPRPSLHVLISSMESSRRPMAILDPNATSNASFQDNGLVDSYPKSPDRQNAIRSGLHVTRPTRFRTASAGGGI